MAVVARKNQIVALIEAAVRKFGGVDIMANAPALPLQRNSLHASHSQHIGML